MMSQRNKLRAAWTACVDTLHTPRAGLAFKIISVGILLATTIYWSLLGAEAQRGNADQLVDAYMLGGKHVFHVAVFPGAHTFLLKWPLFALLQWFDFSSTAFAVMTMLMATTTIAVLAVLLHTIEKRPLIFGTICLLLASMLLLIPAQPYAGAPLPVNMSMITTRNLEYAVYIVCLWIVMKRPLRSWPTLFAVSGLALLIASDKLFALLSLGSGLMAYALYRFINRKNMTIRALRWLSVSVVAVGLASGLLALLNTLHITEVLGEASASPFALTHEPRNIALGLIFGAGAMLTNFGANPAYDAALFKEIPTLLVSRLTHPTGIAFIANAVAFAAMAFAAIKVTLLSLQSQDNDKEKDARASSHQALAVVLLLSTVAAGGAYVFTDHYHPVDARYLFIGFFALTISGVVYTASLKKLNKHLLSATALLAACVVPFAVAFAYTNQRTVTMAFSERDQQNQLIARVIQESQTKVLVGDYWQVIPIRMYLPPQYDLTIMPLSDCVTPQTSLTSKAWNIDLTNKDFMYLAHQTKPGTTIFNKCDLTRITATYGTPNTAITVAGTSQQPTEMLLEYKADSKRAGMHKAADSTAPSSAESVLPISIKELNNTNCPVSTVMNIVAHEDDDLLFINPDTYHSIQAGSCVRTVYVTSGDAGLDGPYWNSRELGAKAAYAKMSGAPDVWRQRTVILNGRAVTIAYLEQKPSISLIFMHIPDGNVGGQGFQASHHTSLRMLYGGKLALLQTLDGEPAYSKEDLIVSLVTLMETYKPSLVRSQSTIHDHNPDHSDHTAVGHFVEKAYEQYSLRNEASLVSYVGYPINHWPANINGDDLQAKTDAFMAYAGFDGAVCHSMAECQRTVYGPFLERQYIQSGSESQSP